MPKKTEQLGNVVGKDFEARDIGKKVDYKTFRAHLVNVGVRISPDDKRALEQHFAARGLKLGQGLRMVIRDYMNQEKI